MDYKALDVKSVRVASEAREIALRSGTGLADSNDLLYGVCVVGLNGANPITDALMTAVGLTKRAILQAIGRTVDGPPISAVQWSESAKRVWGTAADLAAKHNSRSVRPEHVLYGLAVEAKRLPGEGVGLVIHQAAPLLDLNQFVDAIEELIDITDREFRISVLEEKISSDTAAYHLMEGQRLAHRQARLPEQFLQVLGTRIAAKTLELRLNGTVRATLIYLQDHS